MRSLLLAIVLALLVCAPPAESQVQKLRGINVSADITPEDIAVLASWNVKVVRYPFLAGPSDDVSNGAGYDAWIQSAMAKLDLVLPVFEQYGIKVLINLFSPPGDIANNQSAKARVFQERWAQDAILAAWQSIATHYVGNASIWGYDLLNEPAERVLTPGFKNWNTLALQLSQAIRVIDAERPIVVESAFGDVFKLTKLKKIRLKNIVYSVHWYYPLSFQHQGLYGRKNGVAYPKGSFNKDLLEQRMLRIIDFQKKNKAKIFIGEFSAVRWAPKKSAYTYLRDTLALFEKHGWQWAYHAFREADPWSLEHGSDPANHDPLPTPTDRLLLLKKHFAKTR